MGTSDWISLGAFGVASASLAVSVVRMRSDKKRFAAADERMNAQEDANLLLQLHVNLLQLVHAALEHLNVQTLEKPTEEDVKRCRTEAAFLANRSPWEDVRAAANRVLEAGAKVLTPGVREGPIEERDAVRNAISKAMDTASDTIGNRVDALRSARRPS